MGTEVLTVIDVEAPTLELAFTKAHEKACNWLQLIRAEPPSGGYLVLGRVSTYVSAHYEDSDANPSWRFELRTER